MGSLKKHNQGENVLNPFLRLQEEVNHVMSDFYDLFDPLSANLNTMEYVKLSPALDIFEEKNSFKIEVEMAGISEEDVKVTFNENRLTIQAEKTLSNKEEKRNFVSREITYGSYERTVSLPLNADVDKATATFKNGLLLVTIPKKAVTEALSKSIKIQKAK